MEDVLEVYSRPYDKDYPVICMDEKPVQFFADFRKGFRSKKNGVQYEDYQYIRNGTASIFLFTEPLAGWRYADAQERRTAQDWAKQMPSVWRFIIRQNTGAGLILRRLSYPLLVANASQIIESLIFLPFEISLNHGLLQEILLRKELTGISQLMMLEPG